MTMDYETAKKWAQAEANMYKTPQYVCSQYGSHVNRFFVVNVLLALGKTPGHENYRMPGFAILTIYPQSDWNRARFYARVGGPLESVEVLV